MPERKSRRAMFAALLLMASPKSLRTLDTDDGPAIDVEFDTIAELRAWLDATGLNAPDLLTHEYSRAKPDGRPYQAMRAYPAWHGWEIWATAIEYPDPAPLDADTAERLTALAVAG